jgi:hypothetical protein
MVQEQRQERLPALPESLVAAYWLAGAIGTKFDAQILWPRHPPAARTVDSS